MSLLKRNGKSKKLSEEETARNKNQSLLEAPPSPSQSSKLFRKSTSIEPGSDVERPNSQQSGKSVGGGKKKKFPGFLSKVFGGGSKIPAETVEEPSPNPPLALSTSVSEGNKDMRVNNGLEHESGGGRSTSRESINSVLSSSSFSFVNPTKLGGKRVKGKRIPVDDPSYGSTSAGGGGGENKEGISNGDKKTSGGGISSTLDRIGAKIGLKMKYNLQSCESLQYIDAVDEPPPPVNPPKASSASSAPKQPTVMEDKPASAKEIFLGRIEPLVSSSNSNKQVPTVSPSPPTNLSSPKIEPHTTPPPLATSPNDISTSSNVTNDPPQRQLRRRSSTKETKKTCESSAQTQASDTPSTPTPKVLPPTDVCTPLKPIISEPDPLPPPAKEEEPQPSTSAAAFSSQNSSVFHASVVNASNSNTWSNSGRRKRKAPQPPSTSSKFSNGVTTPSSDVVTETPNGVPTSSSQAAMLKKFTRIEESPPPHSGGSANKSSYNSSTFEIRPRKKESSVDPMMISIVTRPTSSFASPGAGNSETLFSRNRDRYHKRSCSEGQGTSGGGTSSNCNTGTRGRVHKQGKKKAPPPPNPFGDPDADEEMDEAPNETTPPVPVPPVTTSIATSESSQIKKNPPPTAPPKVHKKSQVSTSVQEVPGVNPFEELDESPQIVASSSNSANTTESPPATSRGKNTTNSSVPTETSPPTPPPPPQSPDDCLPVDDLMEEIRQNMLNEQQEVQQLGLIVPSEDQMPVSVVEEVSAAATSPQERPSTPPPATTSSSSATTCVISRRSNVICETDIQSAQHALEVLTASIPTSSTTSPSTPCNPCNSKSSTKPDPQKAKLLELKKEAEKSPLNKTKSPTGGSGEGSSSGTGNTSRPISIGSSIIYESPLAILLGKSTGSSNSNADTNSSGESTSPKIPPKTPWYKNLSPSKYYRQHSTPAIKPFSALVKFSELDKEAAKIVEENRRKSEERRLQETERELMELFAATGDLEENIPTTITSSHQSDEQASRAVATTSTEQPPPNKIFTAAQVHTSNNVEAAEDDNETEPEATSSRSQDSSSPTFQSVHAASKHRKVIKPLLTSSPKNNLRSEKLAIVQPQQTQGSSTSSTDKTTEASSAINQPLSSQSTSAIGTTSITTTVTQSSTSSPTVISPPPLSLPISTSRPDKPEWDCPRCTLKNPSWRILCEICFQRKDPPPVSSTSTTSSSSYMSSILQRVNAESSNIKSAAATLSSTSNSSIASSSTTVFASTTSPTTLTPPTIPTTSTSTTTSTTACIPSVVEEFRASSTPSTSSHHPAQSNAKPHDKPTTNIPLHCENFLSQLPAKDDHLAKKEVGKLLSSNKEAEQVTTTTSQLENHEDDPELEELDIGKLRRARLAYFQNHQENQTPSPTLSHKEVVDSAEKPVNTSSLQETKNDLDRASNGETNELLLQNETTPKNNGAMSPSKKNTFADNEDDFLDYMLQLDKTKEQNNLITYEETTSSVTPTYKETSSQVLVSSSSSASGTLPSSSSDAIPQIQRFRPKLEAIREGNSQDYTYCYSSSEIAQIYENWQASGSNNDNINGVPLLSQQISAAPSLSHHQQQQYPRFFGGFLTTHSPVPMVQLPALLADHQPYANNRLSESPEQNYVNTNTPAIVTVNQLQTPTTASLLMRESANFPTAPHVPCIFNGSNIIGQEEIRRNFVLSEGNTNNFNYENNNSSIMSSNGNVGGGGGRRLTYDDYRRMGAIPKGFPGMMMGSREDWSSESSSSSSDCSRGMLQFGGTSGGRGMGRGSTGFLQTADSSPGITRRGTLEFASPSPNISTYPDQTMAVSKLMQRLEGAIAQGDHRLAATLAHDMALMKVNCVVAKINQPFSIRVYVEDRFMQQGPFLVQVSSMMTVRDLRAKIERDWGIPSGFQRWILGRKMAEDDNSSLTSFEITQDSMAFLFLVSPDMGKNNPLSVPPVMETKVTNSCSVPITDFTPNLSNRNIVDSPVNSSSQNVYNNVSSSNAAGLAETTSKSKKSSGSTHQTSSPKPALPTAGTSSSLKKASNIAKEPSPPPLPPKSPVPPVSSPPQKTGPSSQKSGKSSNQNVLTRKDTGSSSQLTADTISAASALTQSLQQKLSEFKAVAEQTFGKSSVVSLPPKQQPRNKEKSPAAGAHLPPSPQQSAEKKTGSQHESSPKRKVDGKEKANNAKPPVRRNAMKSQLSREGSTSKEKLSTGGNTGSREKLVTAGNTVSENRFNGILLQTPKSDEDIKPPERMDRARKSEERSITPSRNVTGSESKVKVVPASGAKSTEKEEPNQSVTNAANKLKEDESKEETEKIQVSNEIVEATSSLSAPQPKPRGIKKQPTVEKISQGTESPTVVIPASAVASANLQDLPKPLPRTLVHSSKAAEPTNASESSEEPQPPVDSPQKETAGSPLENVELHEEKYPQQEVKVDDFCQTTLPFPPAKFRATSTTSGGNFLLRPSAFVTQLNKPGGDSSPLSSAGRSPTFTPPTAFVSPTQSTQIPPPATQEPSVASSSQSPRRGEQKIDENSSTKKDLDSSSTPNVTPTNSNDGASATSYQKMLELMEKQDLICNSEDVECPVCFCPVASGQGIVLRDCLHVFCRECLVGCVEYADDSTVKCPFRDNDYACNNNLQEREIKALVPAEVFEKYLARSVKLAESKIVNTFHCKTPDCQGWCVFEDDVNVFLCPVCKKRNCLTCAAIHEGMDCHKYQRELAIAAETDEDAKQSRLMLEKMIQRGEALDCPACHVVLLKKWGCDWVRCSYCKTEICWVTKGFRWGPGGKGDNSGGCKCGVNGVKCHPKCTYCH